MLAGGGGNNTSKMSHPCQKSGQPSEATPRTHRASGILSTASGVMVKVKSTQTTKFPRM